MNKYLIIIAFLCVYLNLYAQSSFKIEESGLSLSFELFRNNELRFRSMLPEKTDKSISIPSMDRLIDNEVMIHLSGEDREGHHGEKLTGGSLGARLKFVKKIVTQSGKNKEIILVHNDSLTNIEVKSHYIFSKSSPTIRRFTEVINHGKESFGIEYVSSATINNLNGKSDNIEQNLNFYIPYNSWKQESQWKIFSPSGLGLNENDAFNINAINASNLGTWSSVKYLPLGIIENKALGVCWYWQIEHNGSWYWEFSTGSESPQSTYLYLGGPDEYHHNAWKTLRPGETYRTVTTAIGCVSGGINEVAEALTNYRREFLLPFHKDNLDCPVAFNDYMNCLFADPTTEKELPLIEAASKLGCKYYVIDAGWYAELNETWWDAVGLWMPSKTRFTGGLQSLIEKIREKGMIPGLWLEIEVVGVNSPLKDKPDSWFFMRHGKRVIDHGRYLLDFRNPEVVAYCNDVVKRLVEQYGVEYIKMDYNINGLSGTESNSESTGQGLLEHNRAVAQWYQNILKRYPNLVIENCASGGCRMDYQMLSATHLQSTSDQTNYKKNPAIIVGTLMSVLPEQLLTWSYPLTNGDEKEASFNMVNAMVSRILQSGHLANLSKESFKQVKDGIDIYNKSIAPYISKSIPFFPLGLPSIVDSDSPVSVGLRSNNKEFIAVWCLNGKKSIFIETKESESINLLYPQSLGIKVTKKINGFEISFPDQNMAGIVEINN